MDMFTLTALRTNSADEKLIFFSNFSQKTDFDIPWNVKPRFLEKKNKIYFNISSAENFTQITQSSYRVILWADS